MTGLVIYTPAQAAEVAQCSRQDIDAACITGALRAVDNKPESTRRQWRISARALEDWHDAGRPLTPKSAA